MDKRLWNDKIRNLTPYIAGEQPKVKCIKLNTNENPYPPSLKVQEALKAFDYENLRKYPDPSSALLKETISRYYGIGTDRIFLGNGSDEILAMAFQAFFDKGIPAAFPDITYSFYPVYADMYSIPAVIIPLRDDFTIPLEAFKELDCGIVIANPNAPTGIAIGMDDIKGLLISDRNRLVIVDEAYIDFGGESSVGLVDGFDNLLVVQTVSKSRALAGLRVGYAFGSPSLIKALECVRDSFNSYTLDMLAQKLAIAAFEDGMWFERTRAVIIETREWFTCELEKIGFSTLPSKSNFVMTTKPGFPADRLYGLLREKGILVRYFNKPRIDRYLRITIGTREEMEQLIKELKAIFESEA